MMPIKEILDIQRLAFESVYHVVVAIVTALQSIHQFSRILGTVSFNILF